MFHLEIYKTLSLTALIFTHLCNLGCSSGAERFVLKFLHERKWEDVIESIGDGSLYSLNSCLNYRNLKKKLISMLLKKQSKKTPLLSTF